MAHAASVEARYIGSDPECVHLKYNRSGTTMEQALACAVASALEDGEGLVFGSDGKGGAAMVAHQDRGVAGASPVVESVDRPEAGLRQRIFAWALARFNARYERFASTYKQRLLSDLSGTVVEIGPGTGVNLRYLNPRRVRWIGVEPNPFMEPYLREEADRLNMPVEFHVGTAESLPVPEKTADAVISTLVLCSVHSQRRTLQDVLRVLRPGGKLVFLEHVAAPRGSSLRRMQNFVTPVWKRMGDGCNPNRETWVELERAGFVEVSYERITAPVPIVSPQIVGIAKKEG